MALHIDFGQGQRAGLTGTRGTPGESPGGPPRPRPARTRRLLAQRVPLAAGRAPASPASLRWPAGLAPVDRAELGHRRRTLPATSDHNSVRRPPALPAPADQEDGSRGEDDQSTGTDGNDAARAPAPRSRCRWWPTARCQRPRAGNHTSTPLWRPAALVADVRPGRVTWNRNEKSPLGMAARRLAQLSCGQAERVTYVLLQAGVFEAGQRTTKVDRARNHETVLQEPLIFDDGQPEGPAVDGPRTSDVGYQRGDLRQVRERVAGADQSAASGPRSRAVHGPARPPQVAYGQSPPAGPGPRPRSPGAQ